MSAPNVATDPSASGLGSGLGSLSHEVGEAGLLQEIVSNPIPPLLCRMPGHPIGLLVALDPRMGWCLSDGQATASRVELVDGGDDRSRQRLGGAASVVLVPGGRRL